MLLGIRRDGASRYRRDRFVSACIRFLYLIIFYLRGLSCSLPVPAGVSAIAFVGHAYLGRSTPSDVFSLATAGHDRDRQCYHSKESIRDLQREQAACCASMAVVRAIYQRIFHIVRAVLRLRDDKVGGLPRIGFK